MLFRAASSRKRSKRANSLPPACGHFLRQLAVEITEERKRLARSPFLAHEQERHGRREQHDGDGRSKSVGVCDVHQAIAERAVADLVVVLQKRYERGRAQIPARFATRPAAAERRRLALKHEPLGQRAAELPHRRGRILAVVAVRLTGQQGVERVMHVIVPLRVELARFPGPRAQQTRLVLVVLQDEVDGPVQAREHRIAVDSSDRNEVFESSISACTASKRSPSQLNSSSQYSALWI